jgi:hypothetical protein
MFVCDNCGHRNLALGEGHTKMHSTVRISGKVEPSTEERLQLLENKLGRIEETLAGLGRTLGMLVEKSAGGELLAKGDPLVAAIEVGSGGLEGEPGTAETA